MDSVYTQYTDQSTDHVAFTINNSTDHDQRVYLQDLTAYGFKNNIDYITNAFTWIEEREARSWYADIANGALANELEHVYVLCCLRLEPNNYATVQSVVDAINEKLMSTVSVGENKFRRLPCGLYAIQLMREQETGEYKYMRFMLYPYDGVYSVNGSDATPTVRIAPAVLRDQLNVIVTPQNVPLPVNINADMPTCVTIKGSDMELNEEAVDAYITASTVMRKSVHSLTRHAINCDKGITKKLGLNAMTIDNGALFYTTDDAVRLYENGNDYTEFLLNNSMLDMLTLRSYFVNTKVFKGFDDNTEITDVTTGIDREGALWSLNVNSGSLQSSGGGASDPGSRVLTPCDEKSAVTDLLELQLIRPMAIKMSNIQLDQSVNTVQEGRVKQVLTMLPHFTFMANQVDDTSNIYTGTYVLRSNERFEFTFVLPDCDKCEGESMHSHKGKDITYTVSFNDGKESTDVTKYIVSATILGVYGTNRLVSYYPADSHYDDTIRVLSAFPEVRNDSMVNYLEVKSTIDEKYVSSYKYLLSGTMDLQTALETSTDDVYISLPDSAVVSEIGGLMTDTLITDIDVSMLSLHTEHLASIPITESSEIYSSSIYIDCEAREYTTNVTLSFEGKTVEFSTPAGTMTVTPGDCTLTYELTKGDSTPIRIDCFLAAVPNEGPIYDEGSFYAYHDLALQIPYYDHDQQSPITPDAVYCNGIEHAPMRYSIQGQKLSTAKGVFTTLNIPDNSFTQDWPDDFDGLSSLTYDRTVIGRSSSEVNGRVYINIKDGGNSKPSQAEATTFLSTFPDVSTPTLSSITKRINIPVLMEWDMTDRRFDYARDQSNRIIIAADSAAFKTAIVNHLSSLQSADITIKGAELTDSQIEAFADGICSKFACTTPIKNASTVFSIDMSSMIDSKGITDGKLRLNVDTDTINTTYPYLQHITPSLQWTFQHQLVSWYYYRYLQRPNQTSITPRAITQLASTPTLTTTQTDTIGTINYAQGISNTNIGLLNPLVSLPFFPYSDKLYVKLSGISDIDSFIETNSDHETVRGKTLSIIPLSNVYVRVLDTYDVTSDNYTDSSGVVTQTIVPTTISGSSTLTGNTTVQTITQPLNAIIDVPAGESRTIYVTGNLHTYPIYKAPHRLTYEIL